MNIKCWTDYPIVALGDVSGQKSPIRPVVITDYDGDKYVTVIVGGIEASFKRCYVYPRPARCGEVVPVSMSRLLRKRRQDRQ
jgi:hypothetical protein